MDKDSLVNGLMNGTSPLASQEFAQEALRLLLADTRSVDTRRAYEADLRDFFQWHTGAEAIPASLAAFCALPSAPLALALNGYKAHLQARTTRAGRGLSESTVNRRLSALRSLLRMARRLGASCADPSGLVTGEKTHAYRDTRGPAVADAVRLLNAADLTTLMGKRDFALLCLLCENALRRAEVSACDVGDFDAGGLRLMILGKGRGSQKEPVTLSLATVNALMNYLAARGNPAKDAPLFVNAARFSDGRQRLSGHGLRHIVNGYGLRVLGRELHPHALRHMAITATLDATGGDVRTAQRLSRHADIRTLQRYDDNREDLQGRATGLLSALLHGKRD